MLRPLASAAATKAIGNSSIIDGTGGDQLHGGATIAAKLDHRIAMSFAIAGLVARQPVTIDDMAPVATSFPEFEQMMVTLGSRES